MTPSLQRLIDALREELQQHGEVLSLLDAGVPGQPGVPSAPAAMAAMAAAFVTAARSLLQARARRATVQEQFAWACHQPGVSDPASLLALAGSECRPLLQALFEENAALQEQIREQARRGHPWLPGQSDLIVRLLSPALPPAAPLVQPEPAHNVIVLGALSA